MLTIIMNSLRALREGLGICMKTMLYTGMLNLYDKPYLMLIILSHFRFIVQHCHRSKWHPDAHGLRHSASSYRISDEGDRY